MPDTPGMVSLGGVFTLLFVTLGPLKVVGPFAHQLRDADEATVRKIAWRSFGIALGALIAGGFLGRSLTHSWGISAAVLLLTGGIIFFLVGLSLVLEQYHVTHPEPPPLPPSPMAAAMRITFPTVVTPYGVAALIVLLVNSHDLARTSSVLALLIVVMILNLLAMLYARRIMAGGAAKIVLQVLGAVLGVLQVALAIEMVVRGLREAGISLS